jgi:hypothetical protein
MVPVEWPIAAADDGGGRGPARVAGRGRLRTARIDFFLDPRARLTEQERALMTGMLADLVSSLADEFRLILAGAEPANDVGDELFDMLRSSGLLDIPELVQTLLRRAEEDRLASAIRTARGTGKPRFLQSLVSDDNGDVSAAAMALILARGRRRDRFERPRVIFDDLSAEAAVALVNAVAAAFRSDLAKRFPETDADERLGSAAKAILAGHDEGNRLEAKLFDLAHALDGAARIDEKLILHSLEEGEASLLAEILGRRAGLGFDDSWDHLCGGTGSLALLLRMSGVGRPVAGEIIARLADLSGSDAETEIAQFDSIEQEEVDHARAWLRLDPGYRSSIDALAAGHGQRSL